MTQHGVPREAVDAIAREHIELEYGQHLFCFYERPEDWQDTSAVKNLTASLPGVFDIEKVEPLLSATKNFLEFHALLREWK